MAAQASEGSGRKGKTGVVTAATAGTGLLCAVSRLRPSPGGRCFVVGGSAGAASLQCPPTQALFKLRHPVAAEEVPVDARPSSTSFVGSSCAILGLASLALRASSRLQQRAYGGRYGDGGGYGGRGGGRGGGGWGSNMSGNQQEMAREAKRSREAAQFFTYQKRILRTGLPPRDDIYWSREEQLLFKGKQMTSGINFDSYDDIPVERRGGRGKEEEVESFQDCCERFSLSRDLSENLARCQYDKPTPVQKHSMPAALVNTDVMVSAQTGSGKTAAFLVPLISKALTVGPSPLQEGPARPTSIILAPTRELCQQITVEARKLCFRTPIRIVSVYGGADAMPQLKQMAEGCELAICTPGRLEDFLGRGVIGMEKVQHLVLDEADRMLDMGFEPQIRSIVQSHNMPNPGPNGRQTMMFSATFPKEIQELALDFLDPTYLWIGVGRVGSACANVEQRFADVSTVDDEGKFDRLIETVSPGGEKPTKTLVFANSKAIVDDLAWRLTDNRIRTSQIHGGLTQAARDRALNDFRNGRVGVLVATDVAARGLDLPGIDHVVNYELPLNGEDYVHRIGRTGRIGNTGTATSFVGSWEPALRDIVKSIKAQDREQAMELPVWLEQQAMRNSGGSQRRGGGRGGYRGGSAPPRGRGGYDRDGFGRGGGGGRAYSSDRFDRPGRGRFGQDRGGYGQDRGGYGQDRGGYGQDRGGYGRDRDYGGGKGYGRGRQSYDRAEVYEGGGGRGGGDSFDDTPPWARGLPPKSRS